MNKNKPFRKPIIKKQKIILNVFTRKSRQIFPDETILLAWATGPCSDLRLKEQVRPIEKALQKIMKLKGVEFSWKNTKDPRGNIGLIAQEVEKVVPEVITVNPITGFYGLEYDKLTALLIEGMKKQQEQIVSLQEDIAMIKKSTITKKTDLS